MEHPNWKCPKCGCREFQAGEMRAAGSGLASMFDLDTSKFTTVVCGRCAYTEFYQVNSHTLDSVLDLIVG